VTEFETRRADWLSVDDALARVLARAQPLASQRVPLIDALGRALAEPVSARATLPPWANSAMDGYAVRAADVRGASAERPARLPVMGVVRAGPPPETPLRPRHAFRIMTGAALPAEADCVIRVEDTDREATPGVVEIRADRDAGKNVRPAGQDMRAGDRVLEVGTSVGPGQIALAAAAGHAELSVHGRPRVAILSSGDELRTLDAWDDVPRGVGVPETNGPMLLAAVRSAGALGDPPRLALDDAGSIREHLLAIADADVILTSGGASMGEADLIKRVLDELGFELDFWRVTLRPGSPMSFGVLRLDQKRPTPVFGLPGNPASAFVTFELFVRPFLLKLGGHRRIHRPVLRARAAEPLPTTGRLTHFHRVRIEQLADGLRARLTGSQGSGLVQSLGRAEGLAVVPLGVDRISVGTPLDVILLDDGPGASDTPAYRS
jgi:molybdopterin molybdotransferase